MFQEEICLLRDPGQKAADCDFASCNCLGCALTSILQILQRCTEHLIMTSDYLQIMTSNCDEKVAV